MFRTFYSHAVAAALSVAATGYAVIDDKLANLLIAAAVVATTALLVRRIIERRLHDAYKAGQKAERRIIERDLVAFVEKHE